MEKVTLSKDLKAVWKDSMTIFRKRVFQAEKRGEQKLECRSRPSLF